MFRKLTVYGCVSEHIGGDLVHGSLVIVRFKMARGSAVMHEYGFEL
jgi:hypothetical protein